MNELTPAAICNAVASLGLMSTVGVLPAPPVAEYAVPLPVPVSVKEMVLSLLLKSLSIKVGLLILNNSSRFSGVAHFSYAPAFLPKLIVVDAAAEPLATWSSTMTPWMLIMAELTFRSKPTLLLPENGSAEPPTFLLVVSTMLVAFSSMTSLLSCTSLMGVPTGIRARS